jgi:colanic acid/amylovoran biosynthesis glycosyltransferase
MKPSQSEFTVLHSFPIWLSQTQTWMHTQVAELQRLGVNAHVACERTENMEQFGVENIHCLANESRFKQILDKGLRKLRIRRHLNFLVEIGEKTSASIIHSHFGNIGWANLGAVRKLNTKHVVTFYGVDVNKLPSQSQVWRKRYHQLFNEADLFLCEGSHMAHCLIELGCPEHKVKVQHLGVDLEHFEFKPRQWHLGKPLKVLIAASFREKKGIPYAIEALGILRKEIPIELTIIGDAGEDRASQQEKAKILQLLESTDLKSSTRLLGYQSHSKMLQEAYVHHIFLHPSVTATDGDTEGGAPVSIIEMLATGMPVISTLHCDIPEVMRPEAARFLAPERNVDVLVNIAKALLANWHELEIPLKNLRTYIEHEYDHKKQGTRLVKIYQSMVSD